MSGPPLPRAGVVTGAKGPPVVVVGLDCITGLQTARLLARHDLDVIGIAANPKHFCARTNVCARKVQGDTSGPELIEVLERLASDLSPHKAVLYPCSDAAVLQLSAHRARLQDAYALALPRHDVVEMLMSKPAFYRYALEHDFRVPITLDVRNESDLSMATSAMRFPCILKPAVKDARWIASTNKKAFLVSSMDELAALYRRCASWSDHLLVQECVEGDESDLYSCNCYFAHDGVPAATFVARKIRQWPPDTGTSSSGVECRNDIVLNETLRLFRGVDYRGLGYVEIKRDRRTGEHVLIEANIGRPTGRSAIAETGGVEMLFTMYCDLTGRPLPSRREQHYGEAKWMYLRHDMQAAFYHLRRHELDVAEWWRFMRSPKPDAVFSRHDPKPFVYDLGNAVAAAVPVGRLLASCKRSAAANSSATTVPDSKSAQHNPTSTDASTRAPENTSVTYDLHGIVGIRLIDPLPRDTAAVARQLGLAPSPLDRAPDITIRFVDRIPIRGHIRYLGLNECGFSDDGFLVLRGKHKQSARVQIPMDQVGAHCEITCERGLAAVPLLIAIVNFAALAHDYVALHATAFAFGGAGVLVTGWSKGGKTETLLSFMRRGARYVADEWCYLGPNDDSVVGVPEPIRLWHWQLAQLPEYRARLSRGARVRLGALAVGPRLYAALPVAWRRSKLGQLCGRVNHVLERQLNVQVAARDLFGEASLSDRVKISHVLFVVSSEQPVITIAEADPREITARMLQSSCYERSRFLEMYRMFRFAFPERFSSLVETAERREAQLLERALAGTRAYRVEHPYPFDIADVAARIAPLLS